MRSITDFFINGLRTGGEFKIFNVTTENKNKIKKCLFKLKVFDITMSTYIS